MYIYIFILFYSRLIISCCLNYSRSSLLSGLTIQHRHCYGTGLIPGLGTSACLRHGQKKKTNSFQEKKKKTHVYSLLIPLSNSPPQACSDLFSPLLFTVNSISQREGVPPSLSDHLVLVLILWLYHFFSTSFLMIDIWTCFQSFTVTNSGVMISILCVSLFG